MEEHAKVHVHIGTLLLSHLNARYIQITHSGRDGGRFTLFHLSQQVDNGNVEFRRRVLCRFGQEAQAAPLQSGRETVDVVGAEIVEAVHVFHSHQLLRSDVVQDLLVLFGEFFQIRLLHRRGNGGGAVDRGHLGEDLLAVFFRCLFECVEAKVQGLVYFVAGDLTARIGIGGSLDDYRTGQELFAKDSRQRGPYLA